MAKVSFNYTDRTLPLKQKRQIKNFISDIFLMENKILEKLTYIFCSDNYLLNINKKFLFHNTYTDIITFDLSDSKKIIKGEIYISVDRVKENTIRYNTTFTDEFLRVIFHGALHLCGFQDKKDSEKQLMRKKEDFYLKTFHVKQPKI